MNNSEKKYVLLNWLPSQNFCGNFFIFPFHQTLQLAIVFSELRCSSGLDIGARGKPHAYGGVHVVSPAAACVLHGAHANGPQRTDASPKHYALVPVPEHVNASPAAAPSRHGPNHDPNPALHSQPAHDADANAHSGSQPARTGNLGGGAADAHHAGRQLCDRRQTPDHVVGADCAEHDPWRDSSRAGQATGLVSSRQQRCCFGGSQCKTPSQNKVPGIVSKQNNS